MVKRRGLGYSFVEFTESVCRNLYTHYIKAVNIYMLQQIGPILYPSLTLYSCYNYFPHLSGFSNPFPVHLPPCFYYFRFLYIFLILKQKKPSIKWYRLFITTLRNLSEIYKPIRPANLSLNLICSDTIILGFWYVFIMHSFNKAGQLTHILFPYIYNAY